MSNLIQIGSADLAAQAPEAISVPELEKGVGCDFDSYLLSPDDSLDERIALAKEQLGSRLVILGHHYQRDEVVKFADFRGDSLQLSLQAAQSQADYIVFCGVQFMAESADILRQPHQVVILPDLKAGCSMADMADIGQVEACWDELRSAGVGGVVPVTYMNSSAEIKAFTGRHGGSVCTSSNAAMVMRWAMERGLRILFLPDEHLGRNTACQLDIGQDRMVVWDPHQELGGNSEQALAGAQVILWKGYCSVHQRFQPVHVDRVRQDHPGIQVIVHPECRQEVIQKADLVGSTEKIVAAVSASAPGAAWAIGTEIHLVNRLAHEFPQKQILSLDPHVCVCTTMFRISPQHLLWTLENLVEGRVVNRVQVDNEIRRWAHVALERMLELR
ncbi:MAG TPA: quinolinate synthase NadA [Candidatus Dormibacteraeota bacterium]|nr:quinolinate synthase NadA [Candidatus Dormibacteraeota bacterium]